MERSTLGILICEHIHSKVILDWSEEYDCWVPKADLLGWTCYKVHTGNDLLENLHDDKMKSSNLDQYG